jgi:hypothetical protein
MQSWKPGYGVDGTTISHLEISSPANRWIHFGMTQAAIMMNPSISEINAMDLYRAVLP